MGLKSRIICTTQDAGIYSATCKYLPTSGVMKSYGSMGITMGLVITGNEEEEKVLLIPLLPVTELQSL